MKFVKSCHPILLILLILGFFSSVWAQEAEDSLPFRQVENLVQQQGLILLSKDTSIALGRIYKGYTAYIPDQDSIRGLFVFFAAGKMTPDSGIPEMELLQPALAKGMGILQVYTGNKVDFYFDEGTLQKVDSLMQEALTAIGGKDIPLCFAGLSLAGTRAMRYAEYCLLGRSVVVNRPAAVALCDAPLDMKRMWAAEQKALEDDFHPNASGEARWVLYCLETYLGGSPAEALGAYIEYSPYLHGHAADGPAPLFRDIPLRAYHEPDIDWWMKHRQKDYYQINSPDLAGLVNYLHSIGNQRADLITTWLQRAGLEEGASPHSWSIVDPQELVEWFNGILD